MMHDNPEGFVPDIEHSCLGSLLLGEGAPLVRGFLSEHHFVVADHRAIYRAVLAAQEAFGSSAAHLVSRLIEPAVAEAYKVRSGRPFLAYLGDLVSGASHRGRLVEQAAHAVVEQHARLILREELEKARAAASEPGASPSAILRTLGTAAEEIRASLTRRAGGVSRSTVGQAGRTAMAAAREAMTTGGLTGITWGSHDIDRLTGGMQRRDLILLGARPSMGKTTFATNVARKAARRGHGVGFLSLEMDASKLTARIISDLSRDGVAAPPIPYADLIHGSIDEATAERADELVSRLDRLPLEIDEARVSVSDIRAKVEGMLDRFERAGWPRLGLLVVDHLGLVAPGAAYRGNRTNEIGEITGALKGMAKEYDLAILLLSQLSRAVTQRENKRPQLSDLRDSGAIEQDADVVCFVHREAYYLERAEENDQEREADRLERLEACANVMEFSVAKQRNGAIRTVELWCDMACSAVRDRDRYSR